MYACYRWGFSDLYKQCLRVEGLGDTLVDMYGYVEQGIRVCAGVMQVGG